MDEAVADRVCDGGIDEGFVPSFRRHLCRDHGAASVIAVFDHLQQIPTFGICHGVEQEVVEYEDVHTGELSEERAVLTSGPRQGELFEQTRHTEEDGAVAIAT